MSTTDPELERLEREKKLASARTGIEVELQKELEAKRATDLAKRALGGADAKARRDEEKAEADHRKSIVDANAAAMKALLPGAATLKPLEGTVTDDEKSGIVAEAAAYALLTGASAVVAKALKSILPEDARVLILSDRQLAVSDWEYHATRQQIRDVTEQLQGVAELLSPATPQAPATDGDAQGEGVETPEPEMVPFPSVEAVGAVPLAVAALPNLLSALPSVVGAAADVAGYFQSNYKILGRVFELKNDPVVAAMAGALAGLDPVKVVVDGFRVLPVTEVMNSYQAMLDARWTVVSRRLALEQQRLATATANVERRKAELAHQQSALTAAEAASPPDEAHRLDAEGRHEVARGLLHEAEQAKADAQGLVDVAKAVESRADALVTTVTAVPPTGGLPPLGQAALREVTHAKSPKVTHVLHVGVSATGGETQTRQRRFRAPVMRYVGTCTISVLVAETDGTVVYAGSQALVGQLTYLIKNGYIGELTRVELSTPPPAWATGGSD